jgi:hypothetical protein
MRICACGKALDPVQHRLRLSGVITPFVCSFQLQLTTKVGSGVGPDCVLMLGCPVSGKKSVGQKTN